VYLSCFTSYRDEIYHWKEFARNGGACLVLRAFPDEKPPDTYRGSKLGRSAHEVVYDAGVWEARLREGFAAILSEYERSRSDAELWCFAYEARRSAIVHMALVASHAGLSSKHPRYSPEVEWRWIALPHDRHGSLHIEKENGKKFLSLRFRPEGKMLDLEEIIVWGPDPAALVKEAEAILREAGYEPGAPSVRVSIHPYVAP